MSKAIFQTRRFTRNMKRLPGPGVDNVQAAIERIARDPLAFEPCFVDLAALRVQRFDCMGQPYLLGFTCADDIRLMHLEAAGSRGPTPT
jgi:mRNA interferase RelE/StbE